MAQARTVEAAASSPTLPQDTGFTNFDIVSRYNKLIASDNSLTPPIAAIESLISLLSSSQLTTVSETLALLGTSSTTLLKSQKNPIPVSAGTELFQRYLVSAFQQTPILSQSGFDFAQLRNQLISNSKLFVQRAKKAKSKIAHYALPFITEESTVITYGNSRVVHALLLHAAEAGRFFNVIQILDSRASTQTVGPRTQALKALGIPVANISIAVMSLAVSSLPQSSVSTCVLLGTEAVLENGSSVSVIGSHLVAEIAKRHEIPLYIATESYKFARNFPLGYGAEDLARMGTNQKVLDFQTTRDTISTTSTVLSNEDGLVDITPPDLISALITENGVMTPNAVAEELIKLWY